MDNTEFWSLAAECLVLSDSNQRQILAAHTPRLLNLAPQSSNVDSQMIEFVDSDEESNPLKLGNGKISVRLEGIPAEATMCAGSWDAWKSAFSLRRRGATISIFLRPKTPYLFAFLNDEGNRIPSDSHSTVIQSNGETVHLLVTGTDSQEVVPEGEELFASLPGELLVHFAGFLSLSQLFSLRNTSKFMNRMFESIFEEQATRIAMRTPMIYGRLESGRETFERMESLKKLLEEGGHLGYKIVKPVWRTSANQAHDFGSRIEVHRSSSDKNDDDITDVHLPCWGLLTLCIPSWATRSPPQTSELIPNQKYATSDCLVLGVQFFGTDPLDILAAYRAVSSGNVRLISAFGGSNKYVWSVGEWHHVEGPIECCFSGLHYFADSHSAMTYWGAERHLLHVGPRFHMMELLDNSDALHSTKMAIN